MPALCRPAAIGSDLHTFVRSGGRLLTKGELLYDIYVKATGAEEPHHLTSNPGWMLSTQSQGQSDLMLVENLR